MPILTSRTALVSAIPLICALGIGTHIVTHRMRLQRLDQLHAAGRKELRERLERSRGGALGPSSRVAVIPIKEGENIIGSDDRAAIRIQPEALAPYEGLAVLDRHGAGIRLTAQPEITVNGLRKAEVDMLQNGDLLGLGRVTLLVYAIGPSPVVAVHDPQALQRALAAPRFYPPDSEYATTALLTTYVIKPSPDGQLPPGTQVTKAPGHGSAAVLDAAQPKGKPDPTTGQSPPPAYIISATGAPPRQGQRTLEVPEESFTKNPVPYKIEVDRGLLLLRRLGRLDFELKGKSYSLEAYTPNLPRVVVLFKDLTNDRPDKQTDKQTDGSFSGGRLLEAKLSEVDDTVELDFNQAYNFSCVTSKLYACPEITKENQLPVAIPAGEMAHAAP